MKKIILFEDLNKTNFYFCLFLIPFFKKVYFREASYAKNNFFFKKNFNKVFFQIGIEELNGSKSNKAYPLKKFLVKKYINNNFKADFFNKFSKFIGVQDKKKTIYCLENYIYTSDVLAIEATSYICIKNYFVNDCVYYVPSTQKTFLTVSEIQNDKLKLVSLPFLIEYQAFIIKKVFNIIFIKIFFFKYIRSKVIKRKNNEGIKKNKCEIGFFPHEGLKYGNFFKKIFFYSSQKESLLYKKNIDTLSFSKIDKLTKRYLNLHKLTFTDLSELSKIINLNSLFSYINFFLKNSNLIKKNKLINFIIFFEIYLSIKKYNNFFEDRKYKFLFFYNDFLIPPTILLSASINKIKTISFQDRLCSYFYYHRCFFDLYLVTGQKFIEIFKSKYAIKNYQVLGLTRSNLIFSDKNFSLSSMINIKKNYETIACLLLGCRTDWDTSIYGQDGTSVKSIINFCHDIRELSNIIKDKTFIIKFKDIDFNKNAELIISIKKIIAKSNNLILITNNNISSTKLVAHSALTIGKYSTIMDEALIAGKNVLIHDPENFVSTFGFYRKNRFLIANNFEELLFKTNNLLDGKNQFSKLYDEEKKLYVKNYLTDNGITGNQKKIMQLLENYTQKYILL